jgi:hypothetical protein
MAEVLPRHYIIGSIIFMFFIVGGIAMMTELGNKNPAFLDNEEFNDFNQSFNKMNDLTSSVDELETRITSSGEDQDLGVFGVLDALINTGWNTLKLLFSSFGFMEDIFTNLGNFFGIPAWVSVLLISMVTVMFAFAIYTAVFQREV